MIPKVGCDRESHFSSWQLMEKNRRKWLVISSTDQCVVGGFVGIRGRLEEPDPGMWGSARGSQKCCLALVGVVG